MPKLDGDGQCLTLPDKLDVDSVGSEIWVVALVRWKTCQDSKSDSILKDMRNAMQLMLGWVWWGWNIDWDAAIAFVCYHGRRKKDAYIHIFIDFCKRLSCNIHHFPMDLQLAISDDALLMMV